ncbi:hypothetical protein SAMD00019534_093680 [Acytostelium subglobosum LB1]|uniref:hypothetical protein n=1 Tax=Acytostelium subglobosum LB1 TaxID=1410327 RepID=UPI000644B6C2|nr:hypothetical protein SAMD00019534_093680 [Acytostelium subglobosum LB1]GAM26193.1 hypothetical protein SAMD00019534_093680 [Acytostelium subglobosum LB1]|eukprot:XP_012750747.1 hypothetical protein SAMD00019534_093680 [Acytostelium subglobosum LB1]
MYDLLKAVFKALLQQQQSQSAGDTPKDYLKLSSQGIICSFLSTIIESTAPLTERDLLQCIDLMLYECDSLDTNALQDIINLLCRSIETNTKGSIYMLLPKCMMLRSHLSSSESEHAEFQNNTINDIIQSDWPKRTYSAIVIALNDLPLTKENLTKIIQKIERDLPSIPFPDIPQTVYQLLLLASQGQRGLILKTICQHFEQTEQELHDSDQFEQLLNIEATIVVQISFSIKQDMDLGKEYIKMDQTLSPFNIALMLTISKIPRFKQLVLSSLKALVVQHCKGDQLHIQQCCSIIMEIVRYTSTSWEPIVEPFMYFAIALIDTNAIVVTEAIRQIRNLGTEILLGLFEHHETIREKVIDEIIARIQMKAENLQAWFSLLSKISRKSPHALLKSVPKLKESFEYIQYFSTNTVQQLILAFDPILPLVPSFLDSIILTLRKSMFKPEAEARSSAIGGFLQLLKNISYQKPLDGLGIEILGIIKRGLSQQGPIRSQLYTGLKELVQTRPHIGEYICDLLLLQLSNYYDPAAKQIPPIQLSNCIEMQSGSVVTLTEPIDKLVHCIQLCIKMTNTAQRAAHEQQQKIAASQSTTNVSLMPQQSHSLERLTNMFNKFAEGMAHCELSTFPELYDKPELFKTMSNLLLGIIESLIEYSVNKGNNQSNKLDQILHLFSIHTQIKDLQQKNMAKGSGSGGKSKGGKGGGKGGGGGAKKKGKKRKVDEDDDGDGEPVDDDMMDDNNNNSDPKKKRSTSKVTVDNAEETKETLSPDCIKELFRFINDIDPNEVRSRQIEFKSFCHFVHMTCYNYLNKMFVDTKNFQDTHLDSVTLPSHEHPIRRNIIFCRNFMPHLWKAVETKGWTKPDVNNNTSTSSAAASAKLNAKNMPAQTLALTSIDLIIKYVTEHGNETSIANLFVTAVPANKAEVIEVINRNICKLEDICMDSAISHQFWDEADLLTTIMSRLYKSLTNKMLEPHLEFILNIWKIDQAVPSAQFASTTARVLMSLSDRLKRLDLITSVATDIEEYLTHPEDEDEDDEDVDEDDKLAKRILNKKTHVAVEAEFLKYLNTLIDRSKDNIVLIKKDWRNNQSEEEEQMRIGHLGKAFVLLKHHTELLYKLTLVPASNLNTKTCEKFIKTVKKLFTVLTTVVTSMGVLNLQPNDKFKQMVLASSLLATHTQTFITNMEVGPKNREVSRADKMRIIRESKFLPLVTFTLEKYETSVITYEKKMKINERLGKHFTSVALRDFRIDANIVADKIGEDEDADAAGDEPKSKSKPKAAARKTSKAKQHQDDDDDDSDKPKVKRKPARPKQQVSKSLGGRRPGGMGRKQQDDDD